MGPWDILSLSVNLSISMVGMDYQLVRSLFLLSQVLLVNILGLALDIFGEVLDGLGPDVELHVGCFKGDRNENMDGFDLRREPELLAEEDALVDDVDDVDVAADAGWLE